MKPIIRVGLTLALAAAAVFCGRWAWANYVHSPWTRDGRIRANVVTIAPDISGWVTHLYVHDNQTVKKGELLFAIDDTRYEAEVQERQARMEHALHAWRLAKDQYARRLPLGESLGTENLENHRVQAQLAESEYKLAQAELHTARINLERTRVTAPADGTVTNLNLQQGNYVSKGGAVLSVVDNKSFYVTGYFEETKMPLIRIGQKAKLTLMSGGKPLTGKVVGIAKGVANSNTHADHQLLPQVQQSFNWVRLAQRIPVDIAFDALPPDLFLSAGMSVSVQLEQTAQTGK